MTKREIATTAKWAAQVAETYNVSSLVVVAKFKALEKQGFGVVQARNAVEDEYIQQRGHSA